MPHRSWSQKQERQSEHIEDALEQHGHDEDAAEEIAACTGNKECVRSVKRAPAAAPRSTTSRLAGVSAFALFRGLVGRTRVQLYKRNEVQEDPGSFADGQSTVRASGQQ